MKAIEEMTDTEFITYVSAFGEEKRKRLIAEREERLKGKDVKQANEEDEDNE